ncbi:MAG: glycosyltransferase family 2 protein [Burkholderiales bacterium]|nr:glycosyltransferase family 2 protein [Burkholderiales bacterium]
MITTLAPPSATNPIAPPPRPLEEAVESPIELTVLMPCLNEVRTLPACIGKARSFLERAKVHGEILIADNGSTDGSQALARRLGARVIDVPRRGYGAALIAGIEAAHGRYVVMGDSDDSYDFSALDPFLRELRAGAQLVMGNRFQGGILPGAMPALHRWLGNPVLSFLGRRFFDIPIGDFHCGLRGFERAAMVELALRCEGMEFASEMVVKAALRGMTIREVPTVLSPDGRDRPPHLRSWRDGWRHLRFLLLFSPRWLFLVPGMALFVFGLAGFLALLPGALTVGSVTLDVHTMMYAGGAIVMGTQLLMFAVFAKLFAVDSGILPETRPIAWLRRWLRLEWGLLTGMLLLLGGVALGAWSVLTWEAASFGPLQTAEVMRLVISSLTLSMVGVQLLFASMFLGVLELRVHARRS